LFHCSLGGRFPQLEAVAFRIHDPAKFAEFGFFGFGIYIFRFKEDSANAPDLAS
jgi:hypothetical protein